MPRTQCAVLVGEAEFHEWVYPGKVTRLQSNCEMKAGVSP